MVSEYRQATQNLPLAGIKILSFAQMAQGPATVQLFADLGADVVKVERPGSGALERSFSPGLAWKNGESLLFHSFNRNQRSLALDLKNQASRDVLARLVRDSDVLVENFRPGVMEKLGLGYESLVGINPGLVYLSATGFGSDGPYVTRPGQDLILQAMAGLAAATGKKADPPVPAGAPVVDLHAAALNAFSILAALRHRDLTGRGQKVTTNLFEAAIHLQAEGLFFHSNGVSSSERSDSGLGHPYAAAPYGIYATQDGWLALSNSPLEVLAEALEVPELKAFDATDAVTERDRIKDLIEPVIRERATQEWLDRLLPKDVWCGPILDYEELLEDPQFLHNRMNFEMESEIGTGTYLRSPGQYSGVPQEDVPKNPPPRLGENSGEILREIGFRDEEIEDLTKQGAVALQ
ncbi:CaiB/BaiF CoA transferase family protein [Nesterenkonia populi]